MNENQDDNIVRIEIPKALQTLPESTALNIYEDMAYGGTSSIADISWVKEFMQYPFEGQENEVHACFKAAIYIINFFSSEDPSNLHYQVAREILRECGGNELEADEKVRDLLARELVKECRNFASKIIPSILLQEKANDKSLLVIGKKRGEPFEHLTTKIAEKLWIDDIFIKHLTCIGKEGSELAKELSEASKTWYEDYLKSGQVIRLFRLWIDLELQPYYCRYLKVLAEITWKDRIKLIWGRKTNGYPALVKPVVDRMIPISSPSKNKKFIEKDGSIIYCDQNGHPLLIAPAVEPKMISLFQKGAEGLSTLTGHKMLRWQVNKGFERWASGENDPRLIEVDGGYSRIAESIKCTSRTDIAKIKEILHAQAHGRFIFSDGSHGNMITLRIEDRYKNQEPSKIHIVLGEMLLPAYVCQFQRSDKRLIPIGELPPLHGSPNSFASQAQLQLLVFKEFSNQSDRLAENGSILITNEQWKQLAQEAGLSPDKVDAVIDLWCQPDLLNCFLERQGDEFCLASYYERAQKFLENQGRGRIINSQRGKKSIEMKNSKKVKGYQTSDISSD